MNKSYNNKIPLESLEKLNLLHLLTEETQPYLCKGVDQFDKAMADYKKWVDNLRVGKCEVVYPELELELIKDDVVEYSDQDI